MVSQAEEKKCHKSLEQRVAIKGYFFILPALIFFFFFTLLPIIGAIFLSFTSYDGLDTIAFVGLKNFNLIFSRDSIYWKSYINVSLYVIMAVPLSIVLPLLYALLINTNLKGSKIFRAIYYIPGLTSAIAAAAVFRLVFNPNIGVINSFLSVFGIPGPLWLESPDTAMISIVILVMWMGTGGNMIIYFAALKGIPLELYEAARIDGASAPKQFFKITLPLLSPTTFFILTMSIIGAFQLYDQVLMLTNGGPSNSTITPVFVIYNKAFGQNSNMGYASAQAVLLFVVIAVVSLISQAFTKDRAY